MWAALKKAVAGVTESLGIEIPGLPIDWDRSAMPPRPPHKVSPNR